MPSPKAPSEKLLARRAAKVVMNHDALDALEMGMADGLIALGAAIITDATAHAPDQEPYGKGLVESGRSAVWVRGKKVGGDMDKPRRFKARPNEVVLLTAFTAPHAHFAELGTVRESARPFLLPAFNRGAGETYGYVVPAMGKRMKLGRFGRVVAGSLGAKIGAQGGIQGIKR